MIQSVPAGIHIYTHEARHQISRHVYGHFAEHLGWGIYGGLYVGEHSPIPNINGIRLDVLEALRKIRIPNLRWPGGCFADTYHWKDGVGPKEQRPSIVNTWWGGVTEDNSFGTHEFLNLCELLQAEPFISANVGSGTVQELMDWVQYVNFDGISPMSVRRKTDGRIEPWAVKYWGLGNEAWGCGGNMRAEYYADFFRQYSTFMTDWSNSTKLFRIASGAQSSDYHWTEVMMRNIPHRLMEGIGLHHYSVLDWNHKGPAVDFSDAQYFETMKTAWFMEELITRHCAIMDRYDPEKKIALIVDEWGGWYDPEPGTNPGFLHQRNSMRDAMVAAVTLNIFNTHADRVKMANLAQLVNVLQCVILTKEDQMVLTPTYHVMDMFSSHQDAMNIPLTIEAPTFDTINGSLPALSASASLRERTIHVTIANIHLTDTYRISLSMDENAIFEISTILRSSSVRSGNTFEAPDHVGLIEFEGFSKKDGRFYFEVPPVSVLAIRFQI
jgi:alpha-L-arabinofuranosidase